MKTGDCTGCGCHVNPVDYVPVCRIHGVPLVRAEAGNGLCPWVGRVVKLRRMGHETRERCHAWGPDSWVWVPRSRFAGEDLPPYNGFQPPQYDRETGPHWEVEQHQCWSCRYRTDHVVGERRRVCTACGAMSWHVTPQYPEGEVAL